MDPRFRGAALAVTRSAVPPKEIFRRNPTGMSLTPSPCSDRSAATADRIVVVNRERVGQRTTCCRKPCWRDLRTRKASPSAYWDMPISDDAGTEDPPFGYVQFGRR